MTRMLYLALGLAVWPGLALAWDPATASPEAIRQCEADRGAEGCATQLNRLFVCAQAPAIAGCADLLARREAALADPEALPDEEIEPDVTPRAEGELADDPSADAASGVSDDDEDAARPAETGAGGMGDCPVIDSADWQAAVGMVPGHEGPQLVVTGRVTMPTPGWTVALEPGPADRSALPVQRLRVTASPPQGIVSQVVVEVELQLVMPALASYRGVAVDCGGLVLVELAEVGQAG